MAFSYPKDIPFPWSGDDLLTEAYRRGWNHGHGLACHNKPTLGDRLLPNVDWVGYRRVTADNIRDVHVMLCDHIASSYRASVDRQFFDELEEDYSADVEEAYQAGREAAVRADVSEYTDEDYGIEEECESDVEI